MDKNKIKSFAILARRKLMSAVREKASRIGITENKIEKAVPVQGGFRLEGKEEIFKLSKRDRDTLVKEIKEKGFEQVVEEVAYTWFNRFMGLRYMEVKNYLPSGIRVLSSEVHGKIEPDVITRVSEIIEELNLNSEYIYELLDSGKTEDREEAYRYILVKQCNELGRVIPQMFEKIRDYTELLLPDNLLEEGSVIRKMVEDIDEEDWKEEVEIIGWMYQYYILEKKKFVDEYIGNGGTIKKQDLPAKTQIFTPKWIVKYMIENSLGRLWLEGHSNKELQERWKYYIEESEQELEIEEELKKIREDHSRFTPEDIKILDPCMGSGHILIYAFDVLYEIYKSAGYSEREIPRLILENNLYGLDVDDRSAQLASFALIMKAMHYNRRLFREIERKNIELNLCSIQESNGISKEALEYFIGSREELKEAIEYVIDIFNDAKEYGALLKVNSVNLQLLNDRLVEIDQDDTLTFADYKTILLEKLPKLIKQTEIMSSKYQICVTNPPYLSNRGINSKQAQLLSKSYPYTKMDLYSAFIEKNCSWINDSGYMSMVTMESWMFLNSFEKMRKKLMLENTIINMAHIDVGLMGIAFSTSAFVVAKYKSMIYKGSYKFIKNSKEEVSHNIFNNSKNYLKKQKEYLSLPGMQIAYWISDNTIKTFEGKSIKSYGKATEGVKTGNNEKYLRLWHEINICDFTWGKEVKNSFWVPHHKGGEFRKWYGNFAWVINWKDNGGEIQRNKNSSLQGKQYYFKEAIVWSKISRRGFTARLLPEDQLFDSIGPALFVEKDNIHYILAYLNTVVARYLLQIINPTNTKQVGNIEAIPIKVIESKYEYILSIVKLALDISKQDWDSFEESWDFKVHPLLLINSSEWTVDKGDNKKDIFIEDSSLSTQYISNAFNAWKLFTDKQFKKLKEKEEELNKTFIDIYGLQEELASEVEDKDITIRKADRERDIKSLISYAVGCMLGRYSIDAEGLIYAGGDFKDRWDLENKKVRKIEKDNDSNILSDLWVNADFLPDVDNVLPITEDEYFEDDIVSRFISFIKVVYGEETLEENLDFIADSIGRKSSETARQAIRRYFIKDFYKDHLKVYQKRPIYWMFDSGKNDSFKALVYIHRYNEQTIARVRTDYLHTLQRKYEAEIQRQQLIIDSEEYDGKEKTFAYKKIERISKQIEECREYDQIVSHLANKKMDIDLNEGIKVNYAKFQGIKVINSKGKEVKMDLLVNI